VIACNDYGEIREWTDRNEFQANATNSGFARLSDFSGGLKRQYRPALGVAVPCKTRWKVFLQIQAGRLTSTARHTAFLRLDPAAGCQLAGGTENIPIFLASHFSASEGEVPAEPHRQRDWGDFTGVMSAFFARGLPSGGSLRSIRCHPPFRDVIADDEG